MFVDDLRTLQLTIMAQVVVWEVRWLEFGDGGPPRWRWRAFMGDADVAEAQAREFMRLDLLPDEMVAHAQMHLRPLSTARRMRLAGGGCQFC